MTNVKLSKQKEEMKKYLKLVHQIVLNEKTVKDLKNAKGKGNNYIAKNADDAEDLLMNQDLIYYVLRNTIQQKCLIIKCILLIMNMECHILNLKIGRVEGITVVMGMYFGSNKF